MEVKTCTKCSVEKTIDCFNFKNKSENKRHSSCQDCTRRNTKNHYGNNKGYYIKKVYARNIVVRTNNLQFVMDFLKQNPCVDCGETDPIVLEFDHLSDKRKEVSYMVGAGFSLDSIKKEIAKCEVRCCNCHRRKTAKQLNWYLKIKL